MFVREWSLRGKGSTLKGVVCQELGVVWESQCWRSCERATASAHDECCPDNNLLFGDDLLLQN